MRKVQVAAFVIVGLLVLTACGGGGSKSKSIAGGGGAGPFDMQAVGPAGGIVGLNTPFSVTVNFFAPGTTTPRSVSGSVSAAVMSGTGALSGTTTVNVGGATSATFNNLMLNATGAHVLRFTSASATAPADTATFNVVNMYGQAGVWSMLRTGRVGMYYTDSLASVGPAGATVFAITSGSLPAGLSLNTTNGAIDGTPTTAGTTEFSAMVASATVGMSLRCMITIFTANETEITSGQNFKATGPFAVATPIIETFTFTSSFDGITWPQASTTPCRMQIYHPNFSAASPPPSPAPLLVHHRGRGFNYLDYDALGAHVASYGFVFVSVEDYQSFVQSGGPSPYGPYDNNDIARCHTSASAFQEGAMRHVLTKSATQGDPLYQRIDADNIFFSGHSRGGGATHYSHHRAAELGIKGVIYFMAYDLRCFTEFVNGSSVNPRYSAIPTAQPRLPSLIVASECDGDLIYPLCDQLIDRATGPATFMTLYGGNHNFLGDNNANESGTVYISRAEQHSRIFNFVVAFLKRWGRNDLSLEGFLYNNEHAGSTEVGVTAWRGMTGQKLLDNHQGGNPASNTLGGANSITGANYSTAASTYPGTLPWPYTTNQPSMNLRHNIITIQSNANVTYTSTIPAAQQNMSANRRFIYRIRGLVPSAVAAKGFDWVTVRVRLTDAQNDQATITLFDRTAQNNTYLPDYLGTGSHANNYYSRFVEGNILLSAFTTANPALNLNQLTQVQFIFESGTTTASAPYPEIVIDDTRFE
ncbi:MAG: putative Ig domain-containing protein [Planctomycetes bacterium]|nr:putative Ig domain-containing protein [Planctomycetota bacterium]MCW8134094.1 putative Ig domain-containing protein [Planctomycetota bacterium]